MQTSHSRVDTFNRCSYRYYLRYVRNLSTIPDDKADNALFIGTALHTALEKNICEALKQYYAFYPVITDEMETEALKIELLAPKAKKMIPKGTNEVEISDPDFVGYIDLLAPATGFHDEPIQNLYDIYDFKYSNNVNGYKDSDQLHLYKYFFEKTHPGKKIRNLYFLFVPKIKTKQKKNETLMMYRRRIIMEASLLEPKLLKIDYDPIKVVEYMISVKHMLEASGYEKKQSWLCHYCEYEGYCMKGEDYMLLPKNERTIITTDKKKRKLWIYGAPFSGKTYLVNQFPDLLLLSTDGNYTQLPGGIPPHIDIKDAVTVVGRHTERQLGWSVFKEAISSLETEKNDFKTIALDLVEDVYEMCRIWICEQMGITHESDDSFRAWDKVTSEFLNTMRRFFNLDYENIIIISHEDTSKDITKRGGDKITAIKPNIREKVASKLSGMVDLVARTLAEDKTYTLSFKKSEVVFGGGRLTIRETSIQTSYDNLIMLYDEADENLKNASLKTA